MFKKILNFLEFFGKIRAASIAARLGDVELAKKIMSK
jgi:hypothetical protein